MTQVTIDYECLGTYIKFIDYALTNEYMDIDDKAYKIMWATNKMRKMLRDAYDKRGKYEI